MDEKIEYQALRVPARFASIFLQCMELNLQGMCRRHHASYVCIPWYRTAMHQQYTTEVPQ